MKEIYIFIFHQHVYANYIALLPFCTIHWRFHTPMEAPSSSKKATTQSVAAFSSYSAYTKIFCFPKSTISTYLAPDSSNSLILWFAFTTSTSKISECCFFSMRIARICAWNTSRLAYDGSGRVRRGRESDKTMNHYSLCEFTTGKLYHCDLNASYNIGARYFIRELLKPVSATRRQHILANVPECAKRSTCTLSTLISLNAELYASA